MAGERPFWGWNGQLSCSDTVATDLVEHLMNAASWAAKEFPGASAEALARHAASVLGNCSRATGFRSSEEQHGATLAAHCGAGLWEDMADMSKRLWIERAKRLRKRWAVDEMMQRLNEATDCTVNLRSALCGEPEWTDPTLGLYDGAAHALRRLRSEAAHLACLAKTAKEELVAVRDAGQEWRSLAEGFEERALAASAVVSSAKNLVDAWERHGLSGLASQMYDLRSALEKAK